MKLKTYNAPTLHAALRLARIELGSEAVLLEAKERDAETAEARFQVTFALGAETETAAPLPAKLGMPHWKSYLGHEDVAAAQPKPEPPFQPEPPAEPKPRPRAARKTKAQAAPRPKAALAPPAIDAPGLQGSLGALRTPELAAIFGRLVSAGVTAPDAKTLVARAARTAGHDDDAAALEAGLRDALDAGWRIQAAVEPQPQSTRVIALVGPAGAGKSTTAVKAAVLLLRAYDRPAALISVGRHPVGGAETLEAWATLVSLRLEIVESPDGLGAALERLAASPRPPGAVILDTPADCGAAEALRAAGPLETHLVVPATYSPADLMLTIERYGGSALDAAIFTRLDEAAAPGSIWGFQRSTGLPASYLGCGPDTPGDLQPATAKRLTQRLLGR
jgi:flagellar biosynthesis protein FlhF